jgi:iron complex transport system permease protein
MRKTMTLSATSTRRPPASPIPTDASPPRRRRGVLRSGPTRGGGLLVALGALTLIALASIACGAKPMALGTVWDALWSYDGAIDDHVIVRTLRIPRTVLGLTVGAALGVAGAVMQGVTRNPLADPGILGIQSGAALAVVIAITWLGVGTLDGYVWFAFAGAAAAAIAVYVLGSLGRGGATPVKLALAGAAVAQLLASLTTAVLLLDASTLDQFRFWVVGSLAGRDGDIAAALVPFLLVGLLLALGSARSLDALALGDDVARSLGQRVQLARATSLLAVIVLSGAATAACGPIAFVGLTIPHIARAICGPDHRWILPWSIVLGPILLLGADIIGRVVVRPGELQVGIVTALIGAPAFIALVRHRRLAELS